VAGLLVWNEWGIVLETDLESICNSVRSCIEELNTLLGKLEAGLGGEREAGREAYERLIEQLRARQSELENQLQLPGPHRLTTDAKVRNIEAALQQLEQSAQYACRELRGLLTDNCNSRERGDLSTPRTYE
jgi:chromosome segregation ATPase